MMPIKSLVVEMNLGQICYEVQRIFPDKEVELFPKIGGEMHHPLEILNKIQSSLKKV